MTKENMNSDNVLSENSKLSPPLNNSNNQQTVYVLDTNILLHEPFAFLSFKEHDVIVPMTVLEELDSIKDRNKDVSRDARVAIRALEVLAQVEREIAPGAVNGVQLGSQQHCGQRVRLPLTDAH